MIKDHLAPHGRLYLVYQQLAASQAKKTVETLSEVVGGHGFTVGDVLIQDLPAGRVACVVAEDEPTSS